MLVLMRRIGEEILMDGGQIRIKILNIKGGNIAIGIQAPNRIDVDRREIYFKKHSKLAEDARSTVKSELEKEWL